MGAKAFNDWWSSTLGDVPPLGWVLRERFAPRWVRFHTLPDAKRYADTELERAEVVHRQVCVAAAVLGDNRPAWLIVPSYEAGGQQSMRLDEAPGLALTRVGDLVVDDDAHTFWAVLVPWEPQVFEPALRAIADDRLRALWASEDGEIFAPYDGGVDVIARSPGRRAELALQFSPWCSRHPLGL